MPKCGGGVYATSRRPSEGEATWGDVALNAVEKLAAWLASLPAAERAVVSAFQLANEPALSPPGIYEEAVNAFYAQALPRARAHLPSLPLILSFIPPTAAATGFLKDAIAAQPPRGRALLADHHFYLNWQAPVGGALTWDEIHARTCAAAQDPGGLKVYSSAGVGLIVGEWSLAVNHDQPLDLDDREVVRQLSRFYQEQLELFGRTAQVRGAYFWTLRMGSGWDPRPTAAHPRGRQLGGTSAWRSLGGYPFRVWSLLELAAAGVATPLNRSYAGTCASFDAFQYP